MSANVLDVGQCDFDHNAIKSLLQNFGTNVHRAHTKVEALKIIKNVNPALILINRIFDRDGDSGLNFIAEIRQQHPDLKVILISNYKESQEEAFKLGALRGFGKNALGDQDTLNLIKTYLELGISNQGS